MLIMSFEQDIENTNSQVLELVQQRPNPGIFGLHWISQSCNTERLKSLIESGMILGAKFHGSYEHEPLSHQKHWRVLEVLGAKEAILLVHCGRYKEGERESNTSYLHALDVAKMYGGIKVIMAHMGGTDTTVCKKAIKDSRDYDNVYFDTSGITTPYIIEYALKEIPSTRILFGSDAPWCSFRAMYYTVMDANIPEADKYNIMHKSFDGLIQDCRLLPLP